MCQSYGLKARKDFLDMIPKAQVVREQMDKPEFKLKTLALKRHC